MAYRMGFVKRARRELDECCCTYGESLRSDLWSWLQEVAANSETGNTLDSVDVIEMIDEALNPNEGQCVTHCAGGVTLRCWTNSGRRSPH
jgi:hypothetical protein